jgi:hypothetical protein
VALQRATSSSARFIKDAVIEVHLPNIGTINGAIETIYLRRDESLAYVFVRDGLGHLYRAELWDCWFEEDSVLASNLPGPS